MGARSPRAGHDLSRFELVGLVQDLKALLWEADARTGRFLFVSDYSADLLGHPAKEWTDLDFWAGMIHPEDREFATTLCRSQTAAGLDHDIEYRMIHPDGRVLWIRDLVRLVKDPAGAVTHMRGLMLDITDQRVAEMNLRKHHDEQRALARIAMAVAQERSAAEVFEVAADAIATAMGADAGAVIEFRGEQLILRGLSHVAGFNVGQSLPTQARGAFVDVRRTGSAQRLGPAELTANDEVGEAIRREGITSVVVVPIRVTGSIWGCIAVGGRDRELDPDTEARMDRLAQTVSTAISHADARAQLEARANTDILTGLANHRHFQEKLREEVERAHRHDRSLALVLIDLDGFKLINDTHGHEAGDRALVEVARRLRSLARPGDVLARIGGDEFGWVLAEADALEAYAAAERARGLIVAQDLLPEVSCDSSAGVCGIDEAEDPDALMRLADGALYWAKTHGRGVTFRYTPAVVRELSADERAERLARQRTLAGLRALARAVDAKDHSTREHSERVADLAGLLAAELGMDGDEVTALREAALLHDVGKIGVPDAVLFKPDALDDAEFFLVKAHAALGATIASEVLSPPQVSWIRTHHERWDGRGYPDGLAGEAIPIGGRILALADAWDVMVNVRTYKPARSPGEALEECRRCSGSQFWPEAVAALERLHGGGRLDQAPSARANGARRV